MGGRERKDGWCFVTDLDLWFLRISVSDWSSDSCIMILWFPVSGRKLFLRFPLALFWFACENGASTEIYSTSQVTSTAIGNFEMESGFLMAYSLELPLAHAGEL